jgi:hypothetical protein
MKTSCHDIGLDPVRLLAFCPANEDETYVLDVREPMRPAYLSKIVNAALSRHHGAFMAPDGVTLVLESEYDHPPEVASDAPAGLWFYDLTEPADPELLGSWAPASCEPSEDAERACSSHWYNFIPGTDRLVAAWRHEGVFVVDYTDRAAPVEAGFFSPSSRAGALRLVAGSDFWTAYFWHGHVYGSSGGSRSGLYNLRQGAVSADDVRNAQQIVMVTRHELCECRLVTQRSRSHELAGLDLHRAHHVIEIPREAQLIHLAFGGCLAGRSPAIHGRAE